MSDNEFDAELLALAGGDESSSEEENNIQQSPERVAKVDQSPPPRRGVAQKLKPRGRARQTRTDSEGETSLEGDSDIAPSPRKPRSPLAGGDLSDDAPLYPIEGKFRSEADRADIMRMTEIEREEILAERAAETLRRTQNLALRKLLDSKADAEKKRKAGTADLDDGQRKSSRQKTKGSDKIEAYKRQRELKGAQRARGEERRRGDRRTPSSKGNSSDRDASSGQSGVEWDDSRRISPPNKNEPAELPDFDAVRVGRSHMARYLNDPNFEYTMQDCYCRVNIGQSSTGPRYKIGLVKGFANVEGGRPYWLDSRLGKLYTRRYIVIAHGNSEKKYPMTTCSNDRFTGGEFEEYKNTLAEEGIRLPTKSSLHHKLAHLKEMRHHQWTDLELNAKMDKRENARKDFFNYHRTKITSRMDMAKERGDDVTAARCAAELGYLENGGTVGLNSRVSPPVKKMDQQARLAEVNKANRKSNSEEIRKALIAESRAKHKARLAATAKKLAAANDALKAPGDDLFGDSDASKVGTPKASGTATPINGVKREKRKFGHLSKPVTDDDIMFAIAQEMDINIDI